jgi:hypothetical protein
MLPCQDQKGMQAMKWTIEAKVLPLVAGISGHLYLEVFDAAGQRVCQINGLATNPKTMQPRAMGIAGDLLKVYFTLGGYLSATVDATQVRHPHKGRVLFSGDRKDAMAAVDAMRTEARRINAADVPYVLLGTNSNTVFMHLVDAMATVVPVDMAAVEDMKKIKRVLPGIYRKIDLRGDFGDSARRGDSPRKPPGNNPSPKV